MEVHQTEQATDHEVPGAMARVITGDIPFLIPLPLPHDEVGVYLKKFQAVAKIIVDGGRVKLAVLPASIIEKYDPEIVGKKHMSNIERLAFDAFQQENNLPPFDWSMSSHVQKQSRKTFEERAAVMDVLWKHQGTTAGNAAWLSQHMQHLLPLVKAMTKVLAAERRFRDKEDQIIEVETLWFIASAAKEFVRRIKCEQDEVELERKRQRQEALDQLARLEGTIHEMQLGFQQRCQALEN